MKPVQSIIRYHRQLDRAVRRGFEATAEGLEAYRQTVFHRWRSRSSRRAPVCLYDPALIDPAQLRELLMPIQNKPMGTTNVNQIYFVDWGHR